MENVKQHQLQLAVESTSACWAAYVEKEGRIWIVGENFGLKPDGRSQLKDYINQAKSRRWIAQGSSPEKPRTRRSTAVREQLGCHYLYLFSGNDRPGHLLVGAETGLDASGRRFFQVLSAEGYQKAAKNGGGPAPIQDAYMVRLMEKLGETELAELDLGSVISQAAQRGRELVRARGVELALVDARSRGLRVLYSEQDGIQHEPYSVDAGSGLLGRIVLVEAPIVLENEAAWQDAGIGHLWAGRYLAAGIPLSLKGQVIGALAVYGSRDGAPFGEESIQLLKALAPQISISIRNARLFQELSERLKAQKLAEKKIAEAARLTAIGEMAASVAHELNNPLTTITGFTELVLDDVGPDFRQRADLELVLQEARRAREVVRRLLDFSRQGEQRKAPVNINEAVSEIVAMMQSTAHHQSVEVQFELWEDLPPVLGDQNQIKQVLLNLVNNAFYAMPDGGVLVIQTLSEMRDKKEWALIRVRDEGTGISEDHLPLIFEPFFTTKPIGSGTGLGLSISKNLIAEHGGEIRVETEAGRGTTFLVRLPVLREMEDDSD